MVNSTRWNVIATTCTVGWLKMGWGLLVQSPLLKFLLILGLSIQIFYANFDFCLEKISVAAFLNFNQLCGIALITIGCVVRVRPPTKIDTKTQKIQILIIKAIFRDNYMTTGNEWFVGVLFQVVFLFISYNLLIRFLGIKRISLSNIFRDILRIKKQQQI